MQAFCCPPYGQPNGQRVGRPGSCTFARRAARHCFDCELLACLPWAQAALLKLLLKAEMTFKTSFKSV